MDMFALKQALAMNKKGSTGADFNQIVFLTVLVIVVSIMALVLGSVFYLLWNPLGGTGLSLRGVIFNFFNDSNFLTTYPGLQAAFLLLVDFTPAIIGLTLLLGVLALVAFIGIVIMKMAKGGGKR